jgi:hypothetical protein
MKERTNTVPLADRMLAIAARDHLPESHEMRLLAFQLNSIVGTTNDVQKLLVLRDEARAAYCRYTGVSFVEKC